VAALIAIPTAGAIQVVTREIWQATAPPDQPGTPSAVVSAAVTPGPAGPGGD
jgi:hypothetical protein